MAHNDRPRPTKSVLIPGNALQLHLGETADSTLDIATDVDVSPFLSTSAGMGTPDLPPHPAGPAHEPAPRPELGRVRFKSRVRITSGLRRAHSPDSSGSGSPSSSISVPLRYAAARGALGQRLSVLAQKRWRRRRAAGLEDDERTPLRRGSAPPAYGGAEETRGGEAEAVEERTRAQEELAFGRWSWRVFSGDVSGLPSAYRAPAHRVRSCSGGGGRSRRRSAAAASTSQTARSSPCKVVHLGAVCMQSPLRVYSWSVILLAMFSCIHAAIAVASVEHVPLASCQSFTLPTIQHMYFYLYS
ncbi:hypothetical protein FA95DRAFT_335395 [Auriscalpium vulgare]|uniref:Uncharacterized protein n=1 Tax=Auriscalpium vulgare TaxID=40419 RepID=A0ACB8RIE0_9AGAM|nr:hypothetical protein FA95DRAFT_335395 [Auriscalpium vulgare]